MHIWTHSLNCSPKLNLLNTWSTHSHSTRSKAFCWSKHIMIPSSSSRSVYSIMSCIRRLAALILRPFTNLFWSECINFGKTTFNLSARIVAIRNLSLMPWIFQRTWYYYFVKQLREGCRIAEEKPIYNQYVKTFPKQSIDFVFVENSRIKIFLNRSVFPIKPYT